MTDLIAITVFKASQYSLWGCVQEWCAFKFRMSNFGLSSNLGHSSFSRSVIQASASSSRYPQVCTRVIRRYIITIVITLQNLQLHSFWIFLTKNRGEPPCAFHLIFHSKLVDSDGFIWPPYVCSETLRKGNKIFHILLKPNKAIWGAWIFSAGWLVFNDGFQNYPGYCHSIIFTTIILTTTIIAGHFSSPALICPWLGSVPDFVAKRCNLMLTIFMMVGLAWNSSSRAPYLANNTHSSMSDVSSTKSRSIAWHGICVKWLNCCCRLSVLVSNYLLWRECF